MPDDRANSIPSDGMPLVSVIVPVYKVEKYLPRCLESIAAQSYPNLDVILVDDGSPDSCGEICEQFARAHPNVRVLHQANQGQAVARNNGVAAARGGFVTFIDSDDHVEPGYVARLVRLATDHKADVSCCGYIYEYEGKPPKDIPAGGGCTVLSPAEMLSRMNYGEACGVFPWAKLYRRELVAAHPYPPGRIYEDLAATCRIVGDAGRVAFGTEKLYHWRQRPGSTMSGRFSERQFDGLWAAQEQLDYIAGRFPAALPSAKFRHAAKGAELAKIYFESGNGDPAVWKRLRDHVAVHGREVLRDPRAKRTLKFRIRAILLGRLSARLALGFHDWLKRKLL